MRLAILGGGGFRVPLVYGALLRDHSPGRVTEVVLHDSTPGASPRSPGCSSSSAPSTPTRRASSPPTTSTRRCAGPTSSSRRSGWAGWPGAPATSASPSTSGCSARRPPGRAGLAYALRTVPVALRHRRAHPSPRPGRVVHQLHQPGGHRHRGDAVGARRPRHRHLRLTDRVGAQGDRRARARPGRHRDRLRRAQPPRLAARPAGRRHRPPAAAARRPGGAAAPRGGPAVRAGVAAHARVAAQRVPLLLLLHPGGSGARSSRPPQTRGEFLLDQQSAFYDTVGRHPERAAEEWRRVREQRDATYMREARAEGEERDEADVAGGGYEGVALAIMAAISRGEASTMILNIRNGDAVPGLPADAVVEIPCRVDRDGPHAAALAPVEGHQLGLLQQVKAVERSVIEAVVTGSAGCRPARLRAAPARRLRHDGPAAPGRLPGRLARGRPAALLSGRPRPRRGRALVATPEVRSGWPTAEPGSTGTRRHPAPGKYLVPRLDTAAPQHSSAPTTRALLHPTTAAPPHARTAAPQHSSAPHTRALLHPSTAARPTRGTAARQHSSAPGRAHCCAGAQQCRVWRQPLLRPEPDASGGAADAGLGRFSVVAALGDFALLGFGRTLALRRALVVALALALAHGRALDRRPRPTAPPSPTGGRCRTARRSCGRIR